MPAALLCAMLLAADGAPIVVVRADSLAAAEPDLADDIRDHTARVTAALEAVGVPHAVLGDGDLTAARLAGAVLVVLPYNRLTEGQVDSLTAYVRGGGRLVACFATGSDRLPELLGVRRGALRQPEPEAQFAQIRFAEAARAGRRWLPAALDQGSWNAFELEPLTGTQVLATWGDSTVAAVTENAAGCFVGHVLLPGDLFDKGLFLLGLAAERRPALWPPVLARLEQRARHGGQRVRAVWEQLARRADLEPDRRATLGAEVAACLAELDALPAAGEDPAVVEPYRAARARADGLVPRLATSPDRELRGLWVYGSRPVDWPALVAKCRDAGLNAVFYRVARGGSAVYPSDVVPQEEWSKGRDEVAAGLAACHAAGLQFHAWRVCFHLGSAPGWYVEQLQAEGRLSTRYGGETTRFANPGDPRNREVEHRAIRELAEKYPELDGVHLDYIRYTEVPDYDTDYGTVSRREFEATLGRPVANWPFDVERGELKWEYEDWMRSNIDRVVASGARDLRALAPHLCYSAAVWRGDWRYKYAIRQNWPRWLEEGWLDLLVPMNYVTTTEDQQFYAARQMVQSAGNTKLALGIGSWLLDDPAELIAQIELGRRVGADGFVLFSSNAAQIDDQLAALRQGACATPAQPASLAPRARWRVPGGVARRYAPTAYPADAPLACQLELEPAWLGLRPPPTAVVGTISLRDPATGATLAELGGFTGEGHGRALFSGTFQAPAGRVQLVATGHATTADGRRQAYRLHGPVLELLPPDALRACAAEGEPPVPTRPGPVVGVWFDCIADEGLLARLAADRSVAPVRLHRFEPAHLAPLDVLVLPQLSDVGDLRPPALHALREWVRGGGTVLLCHDAVGFRWHPTAFPELGYGRTLRANRTIVATRPLGDRPAGWRFDHLYNDHVALELTANAEVLLSEPDGTPVVARGRLGQGTVLLNGMLSGATGGADAMPEVEYALVKDLLGLPTAR